MQSKWLKLEDGILVKLVPSVEDQAQIDLSNLESLSNDKLNLYKKRKLVATKLVIKQIIIQTKH